MEHIQCFKCFRIMTQAVRNNHTISWCKYCKPVHLTKEPYAEWSLPVTIADWELWAEKQPETQADVLRNLYQLNIDNYNAHQMLAGGATQLDRMFFETHKAGRKGTSQYHRLEPTIAKPVPNHLKPETIQERFAIQDSGWSFAYSITISQAKRLITVFQLMRFDWTIIWHHIMPHIKAVLKEGIWETEQAIQFYENIERLLPRLNEDIEYSLVFDLDEVFRVPRSQKKNAE